MCLAVFKLLEDVNEYAKAFDEAPDYLKLDMHKYATKYYASKKERMVSPHKFIWIDDYMYFKSYQMKIFTQACIDYNYVFLAFELDQSDKNLKEFKIRPDEFKELQLIKIAILLHSHQYARCIPPIPYVELNDIIYITVAMEEYGFANFIWQDCIEKILDTYPNELDKIYHYLFILFVENAFKNGKWVELYDFAIDLPRYIREHLNTSSFLVSIFDKAHIGKQKSNPMTKIELKRLRRNALELIKFSETCLGRILEKPRNFESRFKKREMK